MRFDNKVAIITGGAMGLGAASARLLLSEGASVVILDIDEESLTRTEQLLNSVRQGACKGILADVSDEEHVRDGVAAAVAQYGKLDVLISNAGVNPPHDTLDIPDEEYAHTFAINARAPFLMVRYAVPHMQRQQSGAIVIVSSVGALFGAGGLHTYRAAKASLLSLTRTLAMELAPHQIRVNALCPGAMDTPMRQKAAAFRPVMGTAGIPLGRIASADEVARCVAFLASDDASYVTGAILVADGGRAAV